MHVVYKIFFTKQKIEDTPSNTYWIETLPVHYLYKIILRMRNFELALKNIYRRKSYPCNQCTKTVSQRSDLKPHLRTHMGENFIYALSVQNLFHKAEI